MSKIKTLSEERARVITEARTLNDTITPETSEADAKHIEARWIRLWPVRSNWTLKLSA